MRPLVTILVWLLACLPALAEALTAHEIMALARQQLCVPSEVALGKMEVYQGAHLRRWYAFVLGKWWEADTNTEHVRIDFETAIHVPTQDGGPHSHNRYLLRRTEQRPPAQWLFLPALRRVRMTPYRPDTPLLQSDFLFYDLTAIQNFGDYRYRFLDADQAHPIIEGTPQSPFVPSQRTRFVLERRNRTYLVTEMTYATEGTERHVRFVGFRDIVPQYFRPEKVVVTGEGRTEIVFRQWDLNRLASTVFTPAALETQALTLSGEYDKAAELE